MPLYSIQLFEPTRRSGSRRTCAFQSPMRKSKSCEPSRACAVPAGVDDNGEAVPPGAGDCCPSSDENVSCEVPSKQIKYVFITLRPTLTLAALVSTSQTLVCSHYGSRSIAALK